jgi:cell division protein FtsL
MIRRIFNVVFIALVLLAVGVTYDLKHKAEMAADKNARLETEIASERDAVATLKAEGSVLTQPGRLQEVVTTYADYFKLAPFSPDQIATIDEIPMRPLPAGTSPDSTASVK